MDVVVVREGKNVKGRVLGIALDIIGKRVIGKELAKTAKAGEARNDGSTAAEPASTSSGVRKRPDPCAAEARRRRPIDRVAI